jgi:putative oxidoreductase
MKPLTTFQIAALFLLRLIVGAVFMYAGITKWFVSTEGMGPAMVNLIKLLSIVEPLGAVALVFGFLTRWAASGLALIMAGSLYFVHSFGAGVFTSPKGTGMDYNLLILAACIVLVAFGPGNWSVDAKLRGRT